MSKVVIKDFFTKISENHSVYFYHNGFMVEVSGRDTDENWKTYKFVCNSIDEVVDIIKQLNSIERE